MQKWTDKPWERQEGESEKAFEAFAIYKDMSANRSVRTVAQELNKSVSLIARWSIKWNWGERVRAYDNALEKEAEAAAIKERKEMLKRHVGISMQLQKKALEALQLLSVEDICARDIKEFLKVSTEIERLSRSPINSGGQGKKNFSAASSEQDDESKKTKTVECPIINIPDNGRDKRKVNVIAPQAGPQTMFMASGADVVIYGGAAGGGKTYALLLEALRHKDTKGFGAVIFRHNYTQITAQGGLWDASQKMFWELPDAHPRKSPKLHWQFDSGAKLNFAHIERDEDLKSWQGSEIAYIGFDELTHFTRHQFLYMLSRNRSTCGVRPYVRATCNPDADSWVADFVSWWVNPDTGYPIPERSGIVRYMCVLDDVIHWGNSREELAEEYGIEPKECKSITFIASSLKDNKILMESDPGYLANLKAMTLLDQERLLNGNWKIKAAAGLLFKRAQVGEMLEQLPNDIIKWARGWDLAATSEDEKGDPAYTAGVIIGKRKNGRYVVADVINKRLSASEVRNLVKMTAQADKAKYKRITERLPQDPGQAGKEQAQSYVKMLAGFNVKVIPESGDKVTRAEPFAAQWQAGNVDVLIADWNEMYFNQLESFPESKFKDMVDASSNAFSEIESGVTYSTPSNDSSLGKKSYWT